MNIFVGNLSFSAKEEDVYKAFAGFGAVANVVIVMEKKGKKSRGFGFVEMPNEQEALSAIAALHGKEILGRPVNVMVSLPKKPRSEHTDKRDRAQPQVTADSRNDNFLKRTGKYKQGKRSINYIKKHIDAGTTASIPERKYKANPMRWRKKPRWGSSSQKLQSELKPWEKRRGESKPGEKTESRAKPWHKSSGSSQQPRSRRESLARHKK